MVQWQTIRPGWLLAALIVAGYLAGVIGDVIPMCPHVLAPSPKGANYATFYLAQTNGLVVYYHQYYQLFTSILVTDSAIDAGFNAVAVLILDRLSGDSLNKSRYFLIFFLTAILGNLLTLAEGPSFSSAGASGGIFGVFAAVFSYEWAREKKIEETSLVFYVLLFVSSSFLFSNINWIAHLGGAIGGFIAGPLLYRITKPELTNYVTAYKSTSLMNIGTAAFILLMAVGSIIQFILFAIG
jgi:rhomboid protease GluP